jgi:hypothetical protein
MANRRMFSLQIVDSDAFLDMPPSSQLLYFHLSMRADDDGFVSNPKKILRSIGSQDDDLKVLLTKRFLLAFESGVVVVKHWRIHNYIQSDRYHETLYKDEKKTLQIKDNGVYTDCIQSVSKVLPQVRLGKVRLGKRIQATTSVAEEKPNFNPLGGEIIKEFVVINPACEKYYNNTTQRGACDRLLEHRGLEQVKKVIALLAKTNRVSYLPTITTPLQLEEKWAALEAGLIKEKGKQITSGRGIA